MEGKFSAFEREELCNFIKITNRFTNGPLVKKFEENWSSWVGAENSVMVNSGASGNLITSAILKQANGIGEVIVPAIGWSTDISSLIQLGLKPVFVDVNIENFSMNEIALEEAITPDTIGVVLIHTLGFNGLSDKIIELCKKNNLFLIEDCCEAHGAKFRDQRVGSFGDLSVFSFYYGHHITTIEGGMVCSKSAQFNELAKMFRSHGMVREAEENTQKTFKAEFPDLNPLFTFAVPGFNLRSTEINAFLGLQQLSKIDSIIDIRTNNLIFWLESLDSSLYFTEFNLEGSSNFALPLLLRERNKKLFSKITECLKKNKVEFRIGTAGGGNLAKQPFVLENSHRVSGELINANKIHTFGLYIGNHENVTPSQIKLISEVLNDL